MTYDFTKSETLTPFNIKINKLPRSRSKEKSQESEKKDSIKGNFFQMACAPKCYIKSKKKINSSSINIKNANFENLLNNNNKKYVFG